MHLGVHIARHAAQARSSGVESGYLISSGSVVRVHPRLLNYNGVLEQRSARVPVKDKVTGSNPVYPAGAGGTWILGYLHRASLRPRVRCAQVAF